MTRMLIRFNHRLMGLRWNRGGEDEQLGVEAFCPGCLDFKPTDSPCVNLLLKRHLMSPTNDVQEKVDSFVYCIRNLWNTLSLVIFSCCQQNQ